MIDRDDSPTIVRQDQLLSVPRSTFHCARQGLPWKIDVCTRDGVLRFLKHTPAPLRAPENPVESLLMILESTAAIKLGY